MARLPRFPALGQPLHVIQRGNNRTAMFEYRDDYVAFKEFTRSAITRLRCRIHAYVLMTNHVHLLLSADQPGAVGKVMQSVGRRYVRYFNDRTGRTGTLWEGRYRATVVDTSRYLFSCYRYIEENPVRAGMVRHPHEYRWSSHEANAAGADDPLVTPHELYDSLGQSPTERLAAYRRLFRNALDPNMIAEIRDATNHAWVLGGAPLLAAVQRSGRRPVRAPQGRRLRA